MSGVWEGTKGPDLGMPGGQKREEIPLVGFYRLIFLFCRDRSVEFSTSSCRSTSRLYSSFTWFRWKSPFICRSLFSRYWNSTGKNFENHKDEPRI